MSANCVENVRAHLRSVSASGHSQATSMCAWPKANSVGAVEPLTHARSGLSALAPGAESGEALLVGQLEVHDHGEIAQRLVDLGHAQRVRVDVVAQLVKRLHVQPELVDLLFPDAEGALADLSLSRAGLGHRLAARRDGPISQPDHRPVTGISLDQDGIFFAGDAGLARSISPCC